MNISIGNVAKAKIRALLAMEPDPNVVLLIGKHPDDPNEFEIGTAVAEGNIDISPPGLPIYIIPDANKSGTYRMDRVGQRIPLVRQG